MRFVQPLPFPRTRYDTRKHSEHLRQPHLLQGTPPRAYNLQLVLATAFLVIVEEERGLQHEAPGAAVRVGKAVGKREREDQDE